MAKLRAIKTSFNGGEISKQLFGRVDLESFIASNKQMKNVLPTIYGSAMNRGGTVFIDDNIKKNFIKTVQEITGATNINCITVDWSSDKYLFGCDGGYVGWCDFDFGNVNIIQIQYGGNAIADITSIAAVGNNGSGYARHYIVGTDTNCYSFRYDGLVVLDIDIFGYGKTKILNRPSIENNAKSNPTDVYFIDYNNDNQEGVYHKCLNYRTLITGSAWSGVYRVVVGDNDVSDFDGFVITFYNAIVRYENNVYYCRIYSGNMLVQLEQITGTVIGAKVGRYGVNYSVNAVDVYVYKQIDSKYCICCDRYNLNGELEKELVLVKYNVDCGINKAIFVDERILCVGTAKSVCIYRNTIFEQNFTENCLNYVVNGKQVLCCDGSDNIGVVVAYEVENKKRVLVPFKVNKLINYIVEFGDNIIRFYKDRKLVVDNNGDPYEIGSPYSIDDLFDSEGKLKINCVQSVDVLYICHKDFPIQVLKRYSSANWVLEDFTLVQGPFGDVNNDKNKTLVSNQTEGLITINAVNNASNLSMTNNFTEIANVYINNNDWKGNLTVWQLAGNTIYSSWNFLSIEQAVNALLQTADGANFIVSYSGNTINVTVKASGGSTYNGQTLLLRRFEKQQYVTTKTYTVKKYESSAAFAASSTPVDVFSDDMVGKLIRLNYTDTNTKMWESGKSITTGDIRKSGNNYYKATSSGTTGQIKPTQTSGVVSDGGVSWEYLHSGYGVGTITQVISVSQIKVNADGYFPDFTYGTYLWELGVVGGGIYPNCCTFYKERFVFAISTNTGTKICASCAGDYNNFSDNSFGDILPENAITVLLQGQQESSVLWMHALNKLYIGTACEEFIFGEQTIAEVLSPTNVMCLKVSSLGSAKIEPLQVLDELLFVSNNEKQIANFTYIAERDTFRPINISVMFEHLLLNGVKCWAYTKEPYKTIWFSDKDGNLKSISYDADNKVCAGARHDIGGKIVSLTVIPEPNGNYDELWLVVQRTVAEETVYYTERLSWGVPLDITEEYRNQYKIISSYEVNKITFTNTIKSGTDFEPIIINPGDDYVFDFHLSVGSGWYITIHNNGIEIVKSTILTNNRSPYDYGVTGYGSDRDITVEAKLSQEVIDEVKNNNQVFSDCAKVFEFDEDVTDVTGLYFLEGKTVNVLVDGKIQNSKVVSDGVITLDKAGKVIVVGIKYDWLIETLFINIGANDGTAQALPQRVAKLMARCINTRYLTSKASGGNRYDVVCNSDVLVDDDFEIHLPSDYSRQMTIFFAGDKPVSCCILAIVAEMKTYQ